MQKELNKLQTLQEMDDKIFEKDDVLEALPEENETLLAENRELEEKLRELRDAIDLKEEEKQKRVLLLQKGEEKLKTITGKQTAIKNKEEYQTLVREIDNIKRFNRELEEEIHEIEREIEIKKSELDLIEKDTKTRIKENRTRIEANDTQIAELEASVDKMLEKRDSFSQSIRPAIARKYQRILENSSTGKAIAVANDYVCGNCNMKLPPRLYNNILKAEKIEMCPNCQCILLPPPEVKEEEKPEEETSK